MSDPSNSSRLDMASHVDIARATMDWLALPMLRFVMGSDRLSGSDHDDEGPVRDVSVGSMSVLAKPVSVAAFAAFVDDTGFVTVAEREGNGFVRNGAERRLEEGPTWKQPHGDGVPAAASSDVLQVSWFDAFEFCVWSNTRLLTEAEWERCARHDVESMASNSRLEWVADYYDAEFYRTEQRVNPVGPTGGSKRIARGAGSPSKRTPFLPDMTSNDLTFRVVDVQSSTRHNTR